MHTANQRHSVSGLSRVVLALAIAAPTLADAGAPLGGDFYIAQNGAVAPASLKEGTLVIHLKPAPFQIGTNADHVGVCLTMSPAPEVQADPKGYKDSCLSGAKTGARYPHSDALLVYSGKQWSDGNSSLTPANSLTDTPLSGFRYGYPINELTFIGHHELNLASMHGTLYGYIGVFIDSKLSAQHIMPVQLVFGE